MRNLIILQDGGYRNGLFFSDEKEYNRYQLQKIFGIGKTVSIILAGLSTALILTHVFKKVS